MGHVPPSASVANLSKGANDWKVVVGVILAVLGLLLAIPLLDQNCTVSVTTVPVGAEVVVDGKSLGAAPVRFVKPPGDYEIEIRRTGFFPHKERFTLQGRSRDFTYSLHPEVVRISSDGKGDYKTLADAVAQSPPGTAIRLGEGTHRLSSMVNITKNLSIEGQGMEKTRVASSAGLLFSVDSPGNVQMRNLSLVYEGTEPSSVLAVRKATLTLDGCSVSGARQDEKVRKGGCGISALESTLSLRKCVMQSNQAHGIQLESGALDAADTEFCRNGEAGCAFYGAPGGSVTSCTASGNQVGLLVGDSSAPHLTGNVCINNSQAGILCQGRATADVSGNTSSENGAAISCIENAQSTLRGNECKNNQVGIVYLGNSAGVAQGNKCISSRSNGIELHGTAHPQLESNICIDNGYDGIAYLEKSSGKAVSNVAERNRCGIWVGQSASPEIEYTYFSDNRASDRYDEPRPPFELAPWER